MLKSSEAKDNMKIDKNVKCLDLNMIYSVVYSERRQLINDITLMLMTINEWINDFCDDPVPHRLTDILGHDPYENIHCWLDDVWRHWFCLAVTIVPWEFLAILSTGQSLTNPSCSSQDWDWDPNILVLLSFCAAASGPVSRQLGLDCDCSLPISVDCGTSLS